MKYITSIGRTCAFAVVLAMGTLVYGQTASSAPEHNKTDGNAHRNGSAGDATPPSGSTTAPKKTSPTGTTTTSVTGTSTGTSNDTSHQHTGTADQTKAANDNKNAPGD